MPSSLALYCGCFQFSISVQSRTVDIALRVVPARPMAEEQLKLFDTCSVLQERFDRAFFRSLPGCAGVYLMCDASDRIIYVGKAKNLRQRIGSYRYGRCSRKTARLVARVASIRWRICASEEAALLEENRLLRELRPRFNRMNTWPKASRFVRVTLESSGIQLSLVDEPHGECYGAFKGASRENFGALLRFLCARNGSYGLLPRRLLIERTPAVFAFSKQQARSWLANLRPFLRGESDELLKSFATPALNDCLFHAAFRQVDLLALEHFFRVGPQRNLALREHFGVERLIAQHELDDLIVRHRQTQCVGNANAM
jgi:hypothetical protein